VKDHVVLLPLFTEPVAPPTDRDMLPSERHDFVRTRRTCVLGYGRQVDSPALSVVYYVPTDEDELLVSTMAGRGKARMAEEEDRVVIRCRPYETFAQPPRHLHRNDQAERLTHWISGTVPWDAADPS
jgi:hypothetical protein